MMVKNIFKTQLPILLLTVLIIIFNLIQTLHSQQVYDGCGEKKSCGHLGKDCIADKSCTAVFTYMYDGKGRINFELYTNNDKYYTAIGFSMDEFMGEDAVIACYKGQDNKDSLWVLKTTGKGQPVVGSDTDQNQLVIKKIENDKGVTCQFDIPIIFDADELKMNFINTEYSILIAYGKPSGNKHKIHLHTDRIGYKMKFNFTSSKYINIDSIIKEQNYGKTIHVIGMLFAFIFFMPIGTFISRFYKETCANIRYFKRRLWFLVHIGCMISALIFSLIAYIVIAILYDENDVWYFPTKSEQPSYLHNIVGLIVLFLLIIQCTTHWWHLSNPLYIRLGELVHYIIGTVCYVLALLNIGLSSRWVIIGVTCERGWYIILWIFIHTGFYVGMSAYIYWTDCHVMNGGFRIIFGYPLPLTSMEEAPRPLVRQIILLAFVCTSFLMTVYIIFGPFKPSLEACKFM